MFMGMSLLFLFNLIWNTLTGKSYKLSRLSRICVWLDYISFILIVLKLSSKCESHTRRIYHTCLWFVLTNWCYMNKVQVHCSKPKTKKFHKVVTIYSWKINIHFRLYSWVPLQRALNQQNASHASPYRVSYGCIFGGFGRKLAAL